MAMPIPEYYETTTTLERNAGQSNFGWLASAFAVPVGGANPGRRTPDSRIPPKLMQYLAKPVRKVDIIVSFSQTDADFVQVDHIIVYKRLHDFLD